LIGTMLDVTPRKKVETQLLRQQALEQAIMRAQASFIDEQGNGGVDGFDEPGAVSRGVRLHARFEGVGLPSIGLIERIDHIVPVGGAGGDIHLPEADGG
ncbi:hypothetical protein P8631_15735, partial [Guyparkeria sp. 1SP6A2]|nr:hypothetical protein [Guyparkeria sp. 1SP6A2]